MRQASEGRNEEGTEAKKTESKLIGVNGARIREGIPRSWVTTWAKPAWGVGGGGVGWGWGRKTRKKITLERKRVKW